MTKFLKSIALALVLIIVGCSDGMQIGQTINALILEKKITTLVIQVERNDGKIISTEYQVKDVEFDNQFIKYGDNYINLGQVKSFKVSDNKLEMKL